MVNFTLEKINNIWCIDLDIYLPPNFDIDNLSGFFSQIDACAQINDITLDFSTLTYSWPTGMLVFGMKLRQWISRRKILGLSTYHRNVTAQKTVQSYLMHLGFFDFIGIPRGNEVNAGSGSSSYLPIRRICRTDLDVEKLFDSINEEARKLAGVISGSFDDSETLRTYQYSIRELIRNVFEHSQAEECYVCGQRWQSGRVEFAIIDAGVGICSTLSTQYQLNSDSEALLMAIRPGVSRTNGFKDNENIYDNSGFGLFVLSELGKNFGWFCLGSGTARIVGTESIASHEGYAMNGTFFGARFNRAPHNFRQVLHEIIESGEAEADVTGIARRASGKTRFLE